MTVKLRLLIRLRRTKRNIYCKPPILCSMHDSGISPCQKQFVLSRVALLLTPWVGQRLPGRIAVTLAMQEVETAWVESEGGTTVEE